MHSKYEPLISQLEKDLASAKASLEFWRDQPSSDLMLAPGDVDLSVGRVASLEEEVIYLEGLIAKVKGWDA